MKLFSSKPNLKVHLRVRFRRAIFACDFHVRLSQVDLSHCVLAVCVCLGPEILADSDFDFMGTFRVEGKTNV